MPNANEINIKTNSEGFCPRENWYYRGLFPRWILFYGGSTPGGLYLAGCYPGDIILGDIVREHYFWYFFYRNLHCFSQTKIFKGALFSNLYFCEENHTTKKSVLKKDVKYFTQKKSKPNFLPGYSKSVLRHEKR